MWRNLNDLQFGLDSKGVTIKQINDAQRRMIGILGLGIADGQLEVIGKNAGLNPAESRDLVEKLAPVLFRDSQQKQTKSGKRVDWADCYVKNAFAEIVRIEANFSTEGRAILAARMARSIYVDSLGKTGLALTRTLAAAGIGQIVSHDSRPILPADVGADGFEQAQQGNSRFTSIAEILRRNHLFTRVANANRMSNSSIERIDIAVLISQAVTAPARYAIWARKEIPHLNITFGERFIDITPVIIAGKNPCLKCLDLNRTAEDSAWPALASQALSSSLRFDDSSSRMFAVGLAAKSALLHLDSSISSQLDSQSSICLASQRGFRLDLQEHRIYEFDWPAAKNCGCLD
ncbi:MAG: hypothetical protein RL174_733 [Actinomycetota bacterium]